MKGEFHINKHNKVMPCNAEKIPCRLQDFSTFDEAEATAKVLRAAAEEQLAKEHQEKPLRKHGLQKATGKGRQDQLLPIVVEDHTYAVVSPESFQNEPWEHLGVVEMVDGGNDQIIGKVDPKKALEVILKTPHKDWPESLQELYSKNAREWSIPENWQLGEEELDNGYYSLYDEEDYYSDDNYDYYTADSIDYVYEPKPPVSMVEAVQKWYYSQPNARDSMNALAHVREKGFETAGLAPIDAVKKLLREENDKILPYVENTTLMYPARINFKSIKVNKGYLDSVDPREPKSEAPKTKYDGVLFRDKDGTYRLLDGYHRMKWNKEHDKKTGQFLILV